MNALIKVIVTLVISLFLCSCEFSIAGVDGNGNVVNQPRVVSSDFNSIDVSRAIDVELKMDQNPKVVVIADENLMDLITTEVKNNTLYITSKKNIGQAKSKKVEVSVKSLEGLTTSSGSSLWCKGTLTASKLKVQASSGSEISLTVDTQSLQLSASSGANLKADGKTADLTAKASSGASVDAGELQANTIDAKASSGGNVIVVNAENIAIDESSGGNVRSR